MGFNSGFKGLKEFHITNIRTFKFFETMENYRSSENVSNNDPQGKASFRRTVKKQIDKRVSKWEQKKFYWK